jgi:hypothetical protein
MLATDMLQPEPLGLDLLPLAVCRHGGHAELDRQRQAGAIAQPAAELAGLRVEAARDIGRFGVMRPDIGAKLVEQLAGGRRVPGR